MNRVVLLRREQFDVAAIRVHYRDAGPFFGDENERNLPPIRRPCRVFVVGIITSELRDVFAVSIHREQLFLAG